MAFHCFVDKKPTCWKDVHALLKLKAGKGEELCKELYEEFFEVYKENFYRVQFNLSFPMAASLLKKINFGNNLLGERSVVPYYAINSLGYIKKAKKQMKYLIEIEAPILISARDLARYEKKLRRYFKKAQIEFFEDTAQ